MQPTGARHVGIVVRDRTAAPAPGVYNVCYVNGFQTQPNEKRFWRQAPGLVLNDATAGRSSTRRGASALLDVRTAAKRNALARIVGRWVRGCADDGYAAVEFDNLDSFTRSHGLIDPATGAAPTPRGWSRRRHAARPRGGPEEPGRVRRHPVGYDFAIAEECGRYDECRRYVDDFGDQVLMIEYRSGTSTRPARRTAPPTPSCCATGDLTPSGVHRWC